MGTGIGAEDITFIHAISKVYSSAAQTDSDELYHHVLQPLVMNIGHVMDKAGHQVMLDQRLRMLKY